MIHVFHQRWSELGNPGLGNASLSPGASLAGPTLVSSLAVGGVLQAPQRRLRAALAVPAALQRATIAQESALHQADPLLHQCHDKTFNR